MKQAYLSKYSTKESQSSWNEIELLDLNGYPVPHFNNLCKNSAK